MFIIDTKRILKLAGLVEGWEEDEDHGQALRRTGFWGTQGAGCLFFAKSTQRFLIGYRSRYVEQPHTWGTFGGAVDRGDTPEETVKKEAGEEVGFFGPWDLIPIYVFTKNTFKYSNFIAVVDKEFKPVLNWENENTKWVQFGKWPEPLHFGMPGILNDPHSVEVMNKLVS